MNQVVLVGHLISEPTLTTSSSGKKNTFIILSVKRPFKNTEGLYESDLIKCSLWNNIAEKTCEHIKLGDAIGVRGRLQSEKYEDELGNARYSTYVVAENITFLATKK